MPVQQGNLMAMLTTPGARAGDSLAALLSANDEDSSTDFAAQLGAALMTRSATASPTAPIAPIAPATPGLKAPARRKGPILWTQTPNDGRRSSVKTDNRRTPSNLPAEAAALIAPAPPAPNAAAAPKSVSTPNEIASASPADVKIAAATPLASANIAARVYASPAAPTEPAPSGSDRTTRRDALTARLESQAGPTPEPENGAQPLPLPASRTSATEAPAPSRTHRPSASATAEPPGLPSDASLPTQVEARVEVIVTSIGSQSRTKSTEPAIAADRSPVPHAPETTVSTTQDPAPDITLSSGTSDRSAVPNAPETTLSTAHDPAPDIELGSGTSAAQPRDTQVTPQPKLDPQTASAPITMEQALSFTAPDVTTDSIAAADPQVRQATPGRDARKPEAVTARSEKVATTDSDHIASDVVPSRREHLVTASATPATTSGVARSSSSVSHPREAQHSPVASSDSAAAQSSEQPATAPSSARDPSAAPPQSQTAAARESEASTAPALTANAPAREVAKQEEPAHPKSDTTAPPRAPAIATQSQVAADKAPEVGAAAAPRAPHESVLQPPAQRIANLKVDLDDGGAARATIRQHGGAIDLKVTTPNADSARHLAGEMATLRRSLDDAGLRLRTADIGYRSDAEQHSQRQNPNDGDQPSRPGSTEIFALEEINA